MEKFNEYIIRIHPDPDNLFGKNTEEVWDSICSLAEAYTKELINKNDVLADVNRRSELFAFKQFISKTPHTELEYYSDEEFTDLYLKANCG